MDVAYKSQYIKRFKLYYLRETLVTLRARPRTAAFIYFLQPFVPPELYFSFL
jgi:hypothetical protein